MKEKTKIIHSNKPGEKFGNINPPVIHASTIVAKDYNSFINPPKEKDIYDYGRYGTEPHATLKKVVSELENGFNTILTSCGLQAVTTSVLCNVKAGDHILVSDGVYLPTRMMEKLLSDFAVEVTYFDPLNPDLENLKQDNTKLLFMEIPSSITMEFGDLDAITAFTKKHNIISVVDNTWSAGVLYKPLENGWDVSVQSGTKYISGHSDVMLGVVVVKDPDHYLKMYKKSNLFGLSVAPDDVYLAVRGIKTMTTRLEKHYENAMKVAKWLQQQDLIAEVYYPPLPESPGHEHWKKHCKGGNGLLAFTFKENYSDNHLPKFVDSLKLFHLGASWGGFESLILLQDPARTATKWDKPKVVRLHIGLEDTDDLLADLAQALDNLK